MSEKLAAAEAALKELERPRHEQEDANVAYHAAMRDPKPDAALIASRKEALDKAIAARKAADIQPEAINAAAQAVLDARTELGQSHGNEEAGE